jgi:hypothetical protein
VFGVPFLARRTCMSLAQRSLHSSDTRSPCRQAIRPRAGSRAPYRPVLRAAVHRCCLGGFYGSLAHGPGSYCAEMKHSRRSFGAVKTSLSGPSQARPDCAAGLGTGGVSAGSARLYAYSRSARRSAARASIIEPPSLCASQRTAAASSSASLGPAGQGRRYHVGSGQPVRRGRTATTATATSHPCYTAPRCRSGRASSSSIPFHKPSPVSGSLTSTQPGAAPPRLTTHALRGSS